VHPSAAAKLTQEVVPILILCAAVAIVVNRLPKPDVHHSPQFRHRRLLNWLPLGLTYAFLYMGRYNLQQLLALNIISNHDFGTIDAVGSITYGIAFLVNGPLTDRFGGRFTILLAASGAAICNAIIGGLIWHKGVAPSTVVLTLLYALNMYFQSFGAVAIVKVNASWFHLRERGTFGGIFGILISLGLYLALDWAPKITELTSLPWLFLAPALAIGVFFVLSAIFVRDTPKDAGLPDFDVGDASSGDDGPREKPIAVIIRLLTNRVIFTIACISLCSGFLRQAILKWYRSFAGGVGLDGTFIKDHLGMVLCVAGITGGMFAGILSDHFFHSRRPPVATVLFTVLLVGAITILFLLDGGDSQAISFVVPFMAMSVIGVHGMLSGVASQDFGGRRNAGTATGLIDGFVYFGTAFQDLVYGHTLPEAKIMVNGELVKNPAASHISNWIWWPSAMIPMAIIGLALSLTIYRAVVTKRVTHEEVRRNT
jgi:MFS transporter, OPA family, glycerol-3-phosphate transporter